MPNFKPGTAHLKLGFDYFKTQHNYDPQEDSFVKLANDKNMSVMHFTGQLQYFVSKGFSYYIASSIDHAESDDRKFVRKDTNINRILTGLIFHHSPQSFQLYSDFQASLSLKEVSTTTDDVLADDGSLNFTGGIWLQKNFLSLHNYFYLGLRYRNQDLSSLGLYKMGSEKRFQRFLLGLELHGYTPVTDDGYTTSPTVRSSITDRVNAGSLYNFAINPTLHNIRAKAGYAFSKYVFSHISIESTLIGRNSARGLSFWAALEFRNLFANNAKRKSKKRKRKKRAKKFKEKLEKYNEDLFRDDDNDEDENK